MAGIAGGYYGGRWLVTNPRIRYGAAVIAGWARLALSRAYQWARVQWWRAAGKPRQLDTIVADGVPVGEPFTAPASRPEPVVEDAEIVPDPPPVPLKALTVAARQPRMSRSPFTPSAQPAGQEIPIVSALDDITSSLAAAPAFTPTSGPDAERYMDSLVQVLNALGTRVSSDLQAIGEHLPQEAASLGALASLGEVLGAFATQAGEQVEQWKQTANWVWNDRG